jgi:hypothetical protein
MNIATVVIDLWRGTASKAQKLEERPGLGIAAISSHFGGG